MSITRKTLKDLEFDRVLAQISDYTYSDIVKERIQNIKPFTKVESMVESLRQTQEYLSSFSLENRLPDHSFFEIGKSLHLLGIDNTYIEAKALGEILSNTKKLLFLLRFLKKHQLLYPELYEQSVSVPFEKNIPLIIGSAIDKYGEVSDKASPLLQQIRKELKGIQSQISVSFERALQRSKKSGYLDSITESVIEGKRVLAVQAMHRKKVSGSLLGTSKTGSIVFIAPQATLKYQRDVERLQLEETDEIIRILKQITDDLRPYKEVLLEQQEYFIALEITASKAKYAQDIQAVLPQITTEKRISLHKAYHPLLWRHNRQEGIPTIPQDIDLHKKQQIIVISGPNAGGKSITLKTIGLLQVMLQSGILVPVDEKSKMSFFRTILTDIGDNQSIENQLSTYSYRLKNMRIFLQKCDNNTLFLIDEFGTGTDPELGGALAEVFLEEFYNKEAFGVITTHYANLKSLADELEFASNANMQFDKRSHEPLYELVTGQAGSSFTFEVAQQNGIPYRLINKAKKRVSRSKIRLDKTISKLQGERNRLQKKSADLEQEKGKASEKADQLAAKHDKVQEKLELFQELYDQNQKMLYYGRSINEMTNLYFQTNNKKKLLADFIKWVNTEKIKHTKKNPPKKITKSERQKQKQETQKQKKVLQKVEKEVLESVQKIRKEKQSKKAKLDRQKKAYQYKIGDIVRLIDSRAQGSIERIEGKKVLINYGFFTTETRIDKIELVRAKK